MLENYDKDWQEAGTRREAFYPQFRREIIDSMSSLQQRRRLEPCGSTYEFSVAPPTIRENWFRVLTGVFRIAALERRLQTSAAELRAPTSSKVRGTLSERTRIARELHDTCCKLSGLIFRFQAVRNMLPERPQDAASALETAIDRAAKAITEGRDAVQELRIDGRAERAWWRFLPR